MALALTCPGGKVFLGTVVLMHLEALEREAKEICEELKESVFRMSQYRESLKEMYKELTEMCHKPDMELLQVRKEGPSSERETLF